MNIHTSFHRVFGRGVFLFIAFVSFLAMACKDREKPVPLPRMQSAKLQYQTGIDSLLAVLDRADSALTRREDSSTVRSLFDEARLQYKKEEYLTEYYAGGLAGKMNGPDLLEWDEDEPGMPAQPEGFQVLESFLFPVYQKEKSDRMLQEIRKLQARAHYLRQYVRLRNFDDAHYFDALMLETARIASKGVSGFDSPVAKHSLKEAAASLQGIRQAFDAEYGNDLYKVKPYQRRGLDSAFARVIKRLQSGGDFDGFDRAAFLREFLNPLCGGLREAQKTLGIGFPGDQRALNPKFTTLFDSNLFDPWYFAEVKYPDSLKARQRDLGRLLFFDPLFSGNQKRACASCHQPEKAFSDGRVRSLPFEGRSHILRNAPTLINAALQRSYFYDLRTVYLEDQASQVLRNAHEMHALPDVAHRLLESPAYDSLFRAAFSGFKKDSSEMEIRMRQALAAYIRSLIALDAPFDRYMRGETQALSPMAVKGFNLFSGKAKCATCHFPPLFNGTVPPEYVVSEKEVIGAPDRPDLGTAYLDSDPGRYAVVAVEGNRYAFKTPTLRNADLTAPYMHNGVFKTLEEVIDFYNRGGGQGLDFDLPNQTLPFDSLGLTTAEQADIIEFIRALTDTSGLTERPRNLPSFPSHPAWNKRMVGGVY